MRIYFIYILAFVLYSCNSTKKHEYEYIPLSKFQEDTLALKSGTPVRLLAFSGGKELDKDNVYYYQVIVLNKETGDTVNVLAPLFKIPNNEGLGNKIFIVPLEYNPGKKIVDGTFERKDSFANLLLQTLGDISSSAETPVDVSEYKAGMVKPELVAFNKSLEIFKNNYKYTIGVIAFESDVR